MCMPLSQEHLIRGIIHLFHHHSYDKFVLLRIMLELLRAVSRAVCALIGLVHQIRLSTESSC